MPLGSWPHGARPWPPAPQADRIATGDSAILRFELAYEVVWKLLQRLIRTQGLDAAGPRQVFSQAFKLGWIEDESAWFDIIAARNQAVHVYREATAVALAAELPRHQAAFRAVLTRLP